MKLKKALLIILLVSFLVLIVLVIKNIGWKASSINYGSNETNKKPVVFFCPRDNCSERLLFLINNSEKIHCALFDINLPEIIEELKEKNALLVIDNENYDEKRLGFAKKDTKWQLSHNKFCIFDDVIVWTGSFNPTTRGNYFNNNNVIIFYSEFLAQNYEEEFKELWNGNFGRGGRTKYTKIILNNRTIENYFCPEDWCANRVIETLDKANKSIYFMTFSFTHDKIGDILIKKFKLGVEVKGVFEKTQKNDFTEFEKLNDTGIFVRWDKNKANMHHKVFIIDEKIVITGSFNPTMNGDTRNDENLVIIHDEEIAEKYLEEFRYLW